MVRNSNKVNFLDKYQDIAHFFSKIYPNKDWIKDPSLKPM